MGDKIQEFFGALSERDDRDPSPPAFRMGTVDPAYTTGRPKILFDGDFLNLFTTDEASLEGSLSSWTNSSNATIARVADGNALDGVASLQMISVGAGSQYAAVLNRYVPVTPGISYKFTGYSKAVNVARSTRLYINYYDASKVFLSQIVSGDVASNTSSWTALSASGVAPAGTVYALCFVYVLSPTGAGEETRWDRFSLVATTGTKTYPYVNAVSANDRVLCARAGHTWVVIGVIH